MHNFKLKTGISKVFSIEKNLFEKLTFQSKPYYNKNSANESVQFAVCPQCDNPIEIIGLYKKLKNTNRPYGRHYPHSVKGLANYNQHAFNYCPYAQNRKNINSESRKSQYSDFEKNIYNLMRNQFDRVIYILEKEIDIKISLNFAELLLKKYIGTQGWLYPWATLNNLPWVLGHLTMVKPLYKQLIRKDSPLYESVVENCPNAVFLPSNYQGYEILVNKNGKWLNLEYCIVSHKRKIKDDELIETMEFLVREKDSYKSIDNRFYSKTLTINEKYFLNLVNLPPEKSHRNEKLLKISKRLMNDINI